MTGNRPAAQALVVLVAALAALVPRPEAVIDRVYGRGVYPPLQAFLTGASNAVPVAVFDVAIVATATLLVWWWSRAALKLWRRRTWRPAGRALIATAAFAAVGYLWFLTAWGLNYARPPLDVRLALPAGAATGDEVAVLLEQAIAAANDLYPAAQATVAGPGEVSDDVAKALHAVEARHGRPRPTVPARPKPTLLAWYFRMAGVDGLTAPLALETLLNPDLTPAERPFVLAHEWAHLAGYAPEADANFVAWLVTQEPRTRPRTRYSGWLFLVSETARQMPPAPRRAAMAALGAGPRRDLAEIAQRMAARVEIVERTGWRVYDSYLRAQGVDDGVRSYSRVVDLIVRARRRSGAAPPLLPE